MCIKQTNALPAQGESQYNHKRFRKYLQLIRSFLCTLTYKIFYEVLIIIVNFEKLIIEGLNTLFWIHRH